MEVKCEGTKEKFLLRVTLARTLKYPMILWYINYEDWRKL